MLASLISYTTPIAGVARLERVRRGDTRGYFERIFCAETVLACDWHEPIAQINHSYTEHVGVVRGMHYQRPPHADAKLVSCVRGEVWDVVLDLRCGSPTSCGRLIRFEFYVPCALANGVSQASMPRSNSACRKSDTSIDVVNGTPDGR